jgi:hypothetical protein
MCRKLLFKRKRNDYCCTENDTDQFDDGALMLSFPRSLEWLMDLQVAH